MKTSQHADAFMALIKAADWYKDPGVIGAIAAPFAAVAADAAYDGVKSMMSAKQKSQSFKTMLSENPHLKSRDAKNTQRYFNTLWATNREMAKDPTVAGAFVHQQHGMSDEGFPHRGILAGASDMARMKADMVRGRGPGSQFGKHVGSAVGGVVTALGRMPEKSLAEREKQFDERMGTEIRDLEGRKRAVGQREKAVSSKEDRDRSFGFDAGSVLRDALGAHGSTRSVPRGTSGGGSRRRVVSGSKSETHHAREKKSSPSTLRALLGV